MRGCHESVPRSGLGGWAPGIKLCLKLQVSLPRMIQARVSQSQALIKTEALAAVPPASEWHFRNRRFSDHESSRSQLGCFNRKFCLSCGPLPSNSNARAQPGLRLFVLPRRRFCHARRRARHSAASKFIPNTQCPKVVYMFLLLF